MLFFLKYLVALFLLLSSAVCFSQNLIPNGDFELGPDSSSIGWQFWNDSACNNPIPMNGPDFWNVVAFSPDRTINGDNICGYSNAAYSGIACVSFWGGESGKANLISPMQKDSIYHFTCYLQRSSISSGNPAGITFLFNGGDSIVISTVSDTLWQYFDTTFTATVFSNEITLKGSGHPAAGVGVDSISLEKISFAGTEILLDEKRFKIFPNPTKDFLQIKCPDNTEIKLYNVFGQELFSVNKSPLLWQLDLSSFSKGIYFLQFKAKQKIITKKILLTN